MKQRANGYGATSRSAPYNYSLSQFLADKQAVQQAYGDLEPLAVEKQAASSLVVLSLADAGWSTYGMVIETRQDLVKTSPTWCAVFVEATNIGYANYLYGDRKAADELIKKINPDIGDDYIEKSIPILRAHIDVGDATTKGIGAMSDERIEGLLRQGRFGRSLQERSATSTGARPTPRSSSTRAPARDPQGGREMTARR